jgi:hypothetical protein
LSKNVDGHQVLVAAEPIFEISQTCIGDFLPAGLALAGEVRDGHQKSEECVHLVTPIESCCG